MAFDPDAYLAGAPAKGGFDPDAYLAGGSPRDKLAAGVARQKAKVDALNAQPDPMSVGELASAAGGELKDRLVGMARGAVTLGSAALHPIDTLTTPEKRRQLERGVDDMVTLGYGRKLANRVDPSFAATEQSDAATAPGYREAGSLAGMFMPGATNAIGKGAGAVAGKVIGQAAPGVIGGVGRAALGYELAAPTIAAAQADSAGDRLGSAQRAASDPTSLLLAAGAGAAGTAVENKVKNSRGGQAREFIEREGQGARVGVTTPGSGGVFAQDLADVAPNDQGIGVAAKKASTKILKTLKDDYRAETSAPYKVMKAQIDASPEAGQLRDVTPIVTNMQNAVYDLETAPFARAQLEGQLKILERYRENPDAPVMVPEQQLNGLRRSLMRMAKVGQTDAPGEKEAPLRAAAFESKRMVDEGPYAALNDFYSQGASALTKSRKQLGLKSKPTAEASGDVKKLKLTLEREGQNTKTAGGDSDIAGFRQDHPDLKLQTNLPELARARADLAFHMAPEHGGIIPRLAGAAMGPGAALIAAGTGHGMQGLAAGAGIMALQNATPITGRFLYPLATKGSVANPLLLAAQRQRERDAEMAARLRNGGRP